ncbi:MAG: hypothetical protein ACRDYD_08515, partial [Acidimicrobiales bacterium]
MPRRMEVELTSALADGTWTWRAAGAREPRGTMAGELVGEGAKVGDVLRVEADPQLDGITIVSVLPTKGGRHEPERLEVLGPGRAVEGVTTTLATGGGRSGGRRDDRPRGPGRPSERSTGA